MVASLVGPICDSGQRTWNLKWTMASVSGNEGLTATDEGKTLSKLSSFAIHKGVKGMAGGDVTIKWKFGGDIYLTCSKKIQ